MSIYRTIFIITMPLVLLYTLTGDNDIDVNGWWSHSRCYIQSKVVHTMGRWEILGSEIQTQWYPRSAVKWIKKVVTLISIALNIYVTNYCPTKHISLTCDTFYYRELHCQHEKHSVYLRTINEPHFTVKKPDLGVMQSHPSAGWVSPNTSWVG